MCFLSEKICQTVGFGDEKHIVINFLVLVFVHFAKVVEFCEIDSKRNITVKIEKSNVKITQRFVFESFHCIQ